jgi:hypothetical protein
MRPDQTGPVTNMGQASDGYDPELDGVPEREAARERPEAFDRPGDTAELPTRARRAGSQNDARMAGSWQDIKGRFVDDPAGAIAAAEDMVQQAVDDQVRALEAKIRALKDEAAAVCADDGRDGDGSSTEGRRTRLIRYQEYCERLASNLPH